MYHKMPLPQVRREGSVPKRRRLANISMMPAITVEKLFFVRSHKQVTVVSLCYMIKYTNTTLPPQAYETVVCCDTKVIISIKVFDNSILPRSILEWTNTTIENARKHLRACTLLLRGLLS